MNTQRHSSTEPSMNEEKENLSHHIKNAFSKIAPFWPLDTLVSVNPLQGFEELAIEEAIALASSYFQNPDLPEKMLEINGQTMKWIQAYCDEGQAVLSMPLRHKGLYASWKKMVVYDRKVHKNISHAQSFLGSLPERPEQAILECLAHLGIAQKEHETFLTLLLTTLPGWAAHIKYRTDWARAGVHSFALTQIDYFAMRIVLTAVLWPQAKDLLKWHTGPFKHCHPHPLEETVRSETAYRIPLLKKIASQPLPCPSTPEAQLVFCIDVRSEPLRRAIEMTGPYQTFGCAGFFGIPARITNAVTGKSWASCPVLIDPKCEVIEFPTSSQALCKERKGESRVMTLLQMYHALTSSPTAPCALVSVLGPVCTMWMGLKTFFPLLASTVKKNVIALIRSPQETAPGIDTIPFEGQCVYAENALRTMGLIDHFAPIVFFCGHGSHTENNAYATSLDCGACGGKHGGKNARILAALLNQTKIKDHLAHVGISIPHTTRFIAAEHTTSTDDITLFESHLTPHLEKLKKNLEQACLMTPWMRLGQEKDTLSPSQASSKARLRSYDWAQVRPESGLIGNAAFIIAPRALTSCIDLEGRCFLHSYDYAQDPKGIFLTSILTASMIVSHWINMQYMFSTFDPVAYGGGSKITQNITGKMGMMQGNASDLMTGLSLQAVYKSDECRAHDPQRLMTVVFAPRSVVEKIVHIQPVLKKLFGNGWAQLAVIEPENRAIFLLNRDFSWQEVP
jgi:uncharacterized protein YbcC (UPF0753/DUF2309 family)